MNFKKIDMKSDELIEAEAELKKHISHVYALGAIGNLMGIGFAYHKGSSFWGYVGWAFVGGMVMGIPTRLIMSNKLIKAQSDIDKLKND